MKSRWFFREFQPGDNVSDPDFAKALFSRDSDAAYARALVRESIQNSLDARATRDHPVRMRFAVRTGQAAPSLASVAPFIDGAWEHLHADRAGLDDPPTVRERVAFLLVEDFGTRGLTGDPSEWDPFDAERNPFFLFFRALGRSGKEREARGRWGVGKFVFPLVSRGHCLFGYTVAFDSGNALLMGRMVLKTHRAGDVSFHPDGHWGVRDIGGGLVEPEIDPAVIDRFRAAFDISRTSEPGLSVVVPWLAAEIDAESISSSVIGEYFLPLLRGELVVDIDANGESTRIDATNVEKIAVTLESPVVKARLGLALHAATWPSNEMVVLSAPTTTSDLEWSEARVSEEQRAKLLHELDRGLPVGVRIPLTVRPKESTAAGSHFDVFLQYAEGVGRNRPLIVREGITVPEDKTREMQDYIGLIVIDHSPLATLVGDAETPAHTELQHKLVAQKYTYAKKVIDLVRLAPLGVVRALEQGATEDDFSLLADLFPIRELGALPRGKAPATSVKGDTTPPVVDIPWTQPRYRINRLESGFSVNGTGDPSLLPNGLTIRFAYDVRRGNPLKKYRPTDFSLQRGDVTVQVDEVDLIEQGDNSVVVRPLTPNFAVAVRGFDTNRDVIVRVSVTGMEATT